jgi:hypothetical protein
VKLSKHSDTLADQIHRDDLADAIKHTKKTRRTKSVIQACREVVEGKGCIRFRGVLLDAYSASAVMNIYNAVNEDNRAKYEAMDKGDAVSLSKMVQVAFKLHSR